MFKDEHDDLTVGFGDSIGAEEIHGVGVGEGIGEEDWI